ncbi:L,D-transpeptidase family protein [Chitinophaga filiformis]|uniref:L,D-transpeptidase family protein n=1 Tax=Chitinophaga filiformis TaxID=104663 RepID=UPI001EEE0222|nr:L,D-transpeptidase family protein [Chitinophaga filiformis]MCF6405341.1 L,D-transpeptidase family protein [Chitinophaga filiformis]
MRKKACLLLLLLVQYFTVAAGQQMYWLPADCAANRQTLFNYFAQSELLGLDPHDYAYTLVQQLNAGIAPADSAETDKQLSLAAIAFFTDVTYGTKAARVGYDGLKYTPTCYDISALLHQALAENTFAQLLNRLEPTCPEYRSIKRMIAIYTQRLQDSGYHPVNVISNVVDSTNHPLIDKLYQLGYLDTVSYNIQEDSLRMKVRAAQRLFEFMEDGALRRGVIEELNIPLEKRLSELKHALNTYRWLNCIRQYQSVIVVNIPAAGLYLYQGDSLLLYSRTIVGKERTPTSPLTSRIDEIIMYPYWTVPYNIATRELLPGIKGNPVAYLDAGNYQVLDRSGKILDPTTIDWQSLSRTNFPYTIRQMNGCDNSLGIIKLNFFNPYSTYLHDTPGKSYFMFNKRYFSHGCIRVEDAIPLAKLLLPAEAQRIDSLVKMAAAPQKGPVVIPVKQKTPVFILYEVAWPDQRGDIRFYDDVYNKFR